MSTKSRRLGDLLHVTRVYATCPSCRRSEILNVKQLVARYGPKVPVAWFKRMLRCTRCGSRKAELRIVERAD